MTSSASKNPYYVQEDSVLHPSDMDGRYRTQTGAHVNLVYFRRQYYGFIEAWDHVMVSCIGGDTGIHSPIDWRSNQQINGISWFMNFSNCELFRIKG